MTHLVRGALAAIALMTTTNLAHADWSFTRWGMTPTQVVAASKNQAQQVAMGSVSCIFKETTCGAIMRRYEIGSYQFEVLFGFNSNLGLNSVILRAQPSQFHELERVLLGSFGQPLSSDGGSFPSRIWRDVDHGNRIRLISILGTDTLIEYTPLATGF